MESARFRCCTFVLIFVVLTTLPACNSQISPSSSTPRSSSTTVSPSGGGGSSTPVDVTAGSGGNATFTCSGQFVEWKVYTNPPKLLFSSRDNVNIEDTSKYSIVGQYNLVVKNLDPNNDGETYECRNGPTSYNLANLVVIDEHQFDVSISPPDQVLQAGNVVTFSCSASYGGPTADSSATRPLQPAQDPDLILTLSDGGNLPETVGKYEQPSGATGMHTKIATVNHTIQSSDAGKSVVCTLRSLTYTKTATKDLNMLYAPNRFNNSLNGTGSQQNPIQVTAGLRVRCNANGNPLPTVQWIPLTDGVPSPAPSNSKGYAEMIVPETPQTQKWQCSAYNNHGNSSSSIIYLTVSGSANASEGEKTDEKKDNKVGLGVGLGIGLGVPVLIAIIVIIVILMRRKTHTGGTEVTKTTKVPPSTETGKPINEPHRPQRPVSGTRNGPSINPNPNPMYQPPVYPEQMTTTAQVKTTPDRPGYGDLGVGHIHAGGSTPSLNRSYESSHRGEDDYQPNGPGMRPGPNTSV